MQVHLVDLDGAGARTTLNKMVTANFTGDGNYKTYEQLFCSTELNGGIHNQLICLTVLNIFLSITALLGNTLILVALHKETSLHPPSKLLLRTLTTTDLCVGIITGPLVVTRWMTAMNEKWNICRYTVPATHITGYILCSVSLFTLTAISVDRLLALLLGLRYRQAVTLKRTYLTVIVVWVVSIVGSLTYLWNKHIAKMYGNIGISLCLITTIFSYTKIFLTLRHHQIQVHNHVHQKQQSQAIPLNLARYTERQCPVHCGCS